MTRQLGLFRRGGTRPGAGRKPKGERALVARDAREDVSTHVPVFVTVRLRDELPSMRDVAPLRVLHGAIGAASRTSAFRVVHGSIQSNHVHLVVEARDTGALARGMCGLLVRIARGLNRAWDRRGKVFADRYHARVLRTPRAVRHALVYVLHNARKHGRWSDGVDPYSSGPWFDGWAEPPDARDIAWATARGSPFAPPSGWLLRTGWRRHGLIGLGESPRPDGERAKARPRFDPEE